ncbi:glycosyltransferase [Coxiella endosymbiont of Ornithodoros maritimus]|uniref:glycosyltransferase n=1 Tax=Coxiella endosymbiont of Ornithodoros maritimus TaxID=1656172 RepID=UPI002263FFF2|nr:glycosyltransferase family 1 protein [Coxiella endosymbiont of Ornithodoros maritimus]
MRELHIIEPTLADQTGHCHAYVHSLIQANAAFKYDLHVWLNRRGCTLYPGARVRFRPYFRHRWRKLQKFFCLRSLLCSGKTIFIPTAGRIDLIYLDWLLKEKKYEGKLFLHFHQFKVSEKKMALLKKIAKKNPEFIMMAPTAKLLTIFQESGFQHCELVACPTYGAPLRSLEENSFKKVVYAGAARVDKGFPEVVSFLEYLAEKEKSLPIELQISPPFSGRYDEKSKATLLRLANIPLSKLIIHDRALDQADYQRLFIGGIGLLVYDGVSYQDKFSGVTLDALYAGCPIITVNNTWMGEVVERFQAGKVIDYRSPECIYEALCLIRCDYARFQENAKRAGKILSREHDPANTLKIIDKHNI